MEQKALEIKFFLNQNCIFPNTAIVYDIDDTLIDKYGNPIISIIDTYNFARSKGITVFIITARLDNRVNYELTISQLNSFGINDYKMLFLRPDYITDIFEYKKKAREIIARNGFDVIASIGDMPWDIGIYGGVGFLLR